MKKYLLMLAIVVIGVFITIGCSDNKPTLHIFTWSEYVDMDVVRQFEKENNCRVVLDIFDSNESMFAKIQSGSSGYDIIVPSSYMVKMMADANILEKLDHSKLPNICHIDPAYLKSALDDSMEYGIPYMITYTGLAYRSDNTTVNSKPINTSWSVLSERSDLKGRITLLNDMREVIGAGLIYNGYSINTTNYNELVKARDTVIEWKQNLSKFEAEQYKSGIANGEFLLVHGYSGDIGQVQLDNEAIKFFLPREGFIMSCDEMVIPRDSTQKELAYKFINFMHDPEIASKNIIYTTYWCPNVEAKMLLPETVKNNKCIFPSEEDLERAQVIGDIGSYLEMYSKIWDEIKSFK